MSIIVALPALNGQWAHDCLGTMREELRLRTIVIDNTAEGMHEPDAGWHYRDGANLGVARSWNIGMDLACAHNADWLVVLSEAVRFGRLGGVDLLDALLQAPPEYPILHVNNFAWHLQAIRYSTWEVVGAFDPVFWPAYFEDTDYLYRMGLAGLPSPRENGGQFAHAYIDATDLGAGHSISQRLVQLSLTDAERRYVNKWGGKQGEERWRHPYNDPQLTWRHIGGPREHD